MSKIAFENKKGKITIINKLSYPETVNERVYNAIATGMFEGLLPLSIRQKRKETRIECSVQGLIPLNQYFSGIVTKKMFLDFVHEIALQIKSCEKNMINANNLDLQSDKIFIDPLTKSIKCLFWPIVNNQRDNPPHEFLKQIPYDINFNPHENNEYLETYKAFFNGLNPFSVNNFDKMVLKLAGRKGEGGHSTPSEALSGSFGGHEKSQTVQGKKANIEYDPWAAQQEGSAQIPGHLFCMACGAKNRIVSNFCVACGRRLRTAAASAPSQPQPDPAEPTDEYGTTVLGKDFGGTTVLGYEEQKPDQAVLIRIKTQERFAVNRASFRMGAEQMSCDLVISDNTFISRHHAQILTRNDRYYLVDNGSTNKTFVDGRAIPAKTEIEIYSGTEIRLANEDFLFKVEEQG